MNGNPLTRLSTALSPVLALALVVAPGVTAPAAAQGSADRFAVMVPTFANTQGGRENFGRDLAEEVQKLINDMATHESVDRGELRDALRKYDVKEETLNDNGCINARQLASLIGVNLVLCGEFTEVGDRSFQVKVNVIAPATSDVFELQAFRAENPKQGAQQLFAQFQQFIQGLQFAQYCFDYSTQENWASTMENCDKALAITPNNKSALYSRSMALWKTSQLQEAYAGFQKVLEIDNVHQESMLALGLVASEMGNKQEGLRWFNEYLSLNPGDVSVRLTVASEAAKAGNPEGAVAILEEGMTGDSPDPQLAEYAGLFAMNAAAPLTQSGQIAEARPMLEKTVRYLEPVIQAKGAEADASLYRNVIQAYRLLEQPDKALSFGKQAVDTHPDDATLWSSYADVLNAAGQTQEALTALDRAQQIDPQYAVNGRKAAWLIDAGQLQQGVQAAQAALQSGELTDDQGDIIARKIIAAGVNIANNQKEYQRAIQHYEMADPLIRSNETRGMKAFFHAYALYVPAAARADRQTLEDARATKPIFERVIGMLGDAGAYCQSSPQAQGNCTQIRNAATSQLEIQDLIIKRGR